MEQSWRQEADISQAGSQTLILILTLIYPGFVGFSDYLGNYAISRVPLDSQQYSAHTVVKFNAKSSAGKPSGA